MPEQWRELCAAKMTRTLARQPRKGKTRAYMATLPKRPKIVVSPADYPPTVTRAEARLDAALQALRDARRYAEWERRGKPPSPSAPRKDRRRPSQQRGNSPLLARIADAQRMLCPICDGELQFGYEQDDPRQVTYDHVVPRALGGMDHNNRVAAHKDCNQKKANRPPTGCERLILVAVNAHLERHYAPPAKADRNAERQDAAERLGPQDESGGREAICPNTVQFVPNLSRE